MYTPHTRLSTFSKLTVTSQSIHAKHNFPTRAFLSDFHIHQKRIYFHIKCPHTYIYQQKCPVSFVCCKYFVYLQHHKQDC